MLLKVEKNKNKNTTTGFFFPVGSNLGMLFLAANKRISFASRVLKLFYNKKFLISLLTFPKKMAYPCNSFDLKTMQIYPKRIQ